MDVKLGMTAYTPRFTAKAPDARAPAGYARIARCTTVAACDVELSALTTRMGRTTLPEAVADLHADIDQVLDRRNALQSGVTSTGRP